MTIIAWPYHGPRFRDHRGHVLFWVERWPVGLATSWRWIPKKLPMKVSPIKVSKNCQKGAICFKKLPRSCWISKKLPKSCQNFVCFSYLFWVLKIKNSHIASYQNFICQSSLIISEVLSISLDQQIVYQNDMNKKRLYTDSSELDVLESL